MTETIILDSGPLGRIAHPRPNPEVATWFRQLVAAGFTIVLPEIADYEVRRGLLLSGLSEALRRLDELQELIEYAPITTRTMRRAAEFWAEMRARGQPTADLKALDADVILAAQAEEVGGIVATENVGHLSRLVEARQWRDIS